MWSIEEKIEEIREKPEHIRMRYVYVLVAMSMIFVIAIWLISVKVNISSIGEASQSDEGVDNIRTQLDGVFGGNTEVDSSADTLDELINEGKNLYENVQEQAQNNQQDNTSPEIVPQPQEVIFDGGVDVDVDTGAIVPTESLPREEAP